MISIKCNSIEYAEIALTLIILYIVDKISLIMIGTFSEELLYKKNGKLEDLGGY